MLCELHTDIAILLYGIRYFEIVFWIAIYYTPYVVYYISSGTVHFTVFI